MRYEKEKFTFIVVIEYKTWLADKLKLPLIKYTHFLFLDSTLCDLRQTVERYFRILHPHRKLIRWYAGLSLPISKEDLIKFSEVECE